MDTIKRVGIIGMGMLGTSHAKVVLEHPVMKLCAVCDTYEQKTKELTNKHPEIKSYTDFMAMLHEEKLDIIIVATQDPYHKEPLLAAIGAGIKQIICEKPLTTTLEDAEEVKKAAEEAGASIYLCFMLRMSTLNRAFRLLVRGGYLGKLLHGEFVNDDSYFVPTEYWGERSSQWAKTSSPIQFLFSHTVDCLRYFFAPNEITKVYALGKQEGTGSACDYCEALLSWSDDSVVRIKTDWMRKIATLVETYGVYTFEDAGVIHRSTDAGGGESMLRIDFNERSKMEAAAQALEAQGFTIHMEISPKAYAKYALLLYPNENSQGRSFPASTYLLDYILGDKTNQDSIVDLAGGYKQVKVIDAIFESMKKDAPVEIL